MQKGYFLENFLLTSFLDTICFIFTPVIIKTRNILTEVLHLLTNHLLIILYGLLKQNIIFFL